MLIEAEHLLTFASVARTGSLSKTAKELFKSQPAISAQLKRLQEAIGEPLYTRHRYGIQLTKTGNALLPYAQTLLRSLEGARQYASELKEGHAGQLRIAASTTIALYYLPKLLKRFSDQHPNIELSILTCNSQEALDLLKSNRSDLAMTEGPDEAIELEHSVIAKDEIVLAVLPNHPLANKKVLKLKDIEGVRLVRREFGSGTRAVVDKILQDANVSTNTSLEAKGVDAIKEAILQGFGPGFLSRLALQREVEMGLLKTLRFDSTAFQRPLTLLHAKLELCSQNARRFISFLEAEL